LWSDTPSLAVVDGKFGYGKPSRRRPSGSVSRSAGAGLAAGALRNAGHSAAWRLAEMAAAEDWSRSIRQRRGLRCCGAHAASRSGVDRAYCVGIPRQGQDPIVLDFATSIVAEGTRLLCKPRRQKLPDGALSTSTHVERDPAVLYGPYSARAARPHQGHRRNPRVRRAKGSGLAFICECSGALTAPAPPRRTAFRQRPVRRLMFDPRCDTSHFFDGENLAVCHFTGDKPVAGVECLLIPGDPKRKMRPIAPKTGCPCLTYWAAIVNTAATSA